LEHQKTNGKRKAKRIKTFVNCTIINVFRNPKGREGGLGMEWEMSLKLQRIGFSLRLNAFVSRINGQVYNILFLRFVIAFNACY
jgi:hypothetical protein